MTEKKSGDEEGKVRIWFGWSFQLENLQKKY